MTVNAGIILQGIIVGIPYGLLAVGLVLVYKVSRFINFAQGALGAFGGALVGTLVVSYGVPYWLAFVVGIVFAAGVATATEQTIVRRLNGQPRLMGVVVTLLLAQFLLAASFAINTDAQVGTTYPSPPGVPSFTVGDLVVVPSYTALLILSPLLVIGLGLLLSKTRFGTAIRATSANPDAAWVAGISPYRIAGRTWAIAGGIAAFSAILLWPTQGVNALGVLGPSLMLRGLIAASIARFDRVWVAFLAGIGVGLLDTLARAQNATSGVVDLVLTGVALVVLLVWPPKRSRQSDSDGDWTKLAVRPIDPAYRKLFIGRHFGPVMTVVLFMVAALVMPFWISNASALNLTTVVAYGIVALSVFLLTGRAGQLSLGQFAIAGVAAVASIRAVEETGLFFVGPVAAVLVGGATSVVLGLPALRSKGLVLPITTLAFALATRSWILPQDWALGDGRAAAQPVLGSLALDTPKSYYFYALAVLAIAVLVTWYVSRGRFGEELLALRDNENAARALGISRVWRRIQVFVVAGGLAGLGGSLLAHSRPLLTANEFPATASIVVVVMAVVGGLGVIAGPLIGALLVVGVPNLIGLDIIAIAGLQALFLVVIVFRPGGFATILLPIRDWIIEEAARLRGIDPNAVGKDVPQRSTPFASALQPHIPKASGSSADPILEADDLSKAFGGIQAVREVSLHVSEGESVAIIGPNGAGKTTLFEIIAGFVRPNAGRVRFNGADVSRMGPHRRARAGLVRSFQNALLFPTMTVRETVDIAARRGGAGVDVDQLLQSVGLVAYAGEAVGTLSTGVRRMVELTADLALRPRVLLLDEPSAGIAHSEIPALANLLRTVHADGVTLVVIDHDMNLLRATCDRFVALDQGSVLATGTADEVQSDPAVMEAFLGPDMVAVERSAPLAQAAPHSG